MDDFTIFQKAVHARYTELAKQQKAIDRKKILDVIAAKKDEKLSQASLEDLEKQLAALDA